MKVEFPSLDFIRLGLIHSINTLRSIFFIIALCSCKQAFSQVSYGSSWVSEVASDTTYINALLDSVDRVLIKDHFQGADSIASRKADALLKLEEAIKLSEKINYDKGEYLGHWLFGFYYFAHEFNSEKSIAHFTTATPYILQTKDFFKLKTMYLVLGNMYRQMGKINYAKKSYYQLIKICESNGDSTSVASAHSYLSYLFLMEKRYSEAMKHTELAYAHWKKVNFQDGKISCLSRLGEIQLEGNNDPKKAREYFNEALTLAKEKDLFPYFGAALEMNLGHAYFKEGDTTKAIHFLKLASSHFQVDLSSTADMYTVLNKSYLAEVFIAQRRFAMAEKYLLDAVNNIQNIKDFVKSDELAIYNLLSTLYETWGKYSLALKWKKKHATLFEEITENQQKQVEDLEAFYQAEQNAAENTMLRSKEIATRKTILLQQIMLITSIIILMLTFAVVILRRRTRRQIKMKNVELNSMNQKLTESVLIRERLLSVLAHDIRGPLSNIQSLNYLKKLALPEDIVKLEEGIENCVNATVNLLNNILAWSSAQLTDNKSAIIETIEVFQVVEDIYKTYLPLAQQKGLKLVLEPGVDPTIALRTDASTLHMAIRNLVSNAIKFTKVGSVVIRYASVDSETVLFEVIDTGIGIPEEKVQLILHGHNAGKKTSGTNEERGTGLGIMLCQSFLQKLNSRIRYRRNQSGTGSVFYFTLSNQISFVPKRQPKENDSATPLAHSSTIDLEKQRKHL